MKYKFKPQKAILVAGVLAAAYAEACWYQNTSAVCFHSGDTVDQINWSDTTPSYVYADQDWLVYATYSLVYTGSGPVGRSNYNLDPINPAPSSCNGAAHFRDHSGQSISLSWQNAVASLNLATYHFTTTVYAGTVDTNSATCDN